MRNIPVDVSALTFVCVSAPRPKVVDQDTGEVKTDRNGRTVFTVGLSAADSMGRVDLLNVAVVGEQSVTIGEVVTPVGLAAFPWEAVLGGEKRWGVAYRADRVAPVSEAGPAGSASSGSGSAAAGVPEPLRPVPVVAARLGHADPAITLRVYAHVVNEQLAEAAEIFAGRVYGVA